MSTIIEKIKKLRGLSQSPNLHEAQAAARLAERLLQEHCLGEADLGAAPEDQGGIVEEDPSFVNWGKKIIRWQSSLMGGLAKQYQCAVVIDKTGGQSRIRAYGRNDDLETLRYQYAFFVTEINRLAKHEKGITARNSFSLGAAIEILRTLKDASQEARKQATSSALTVVDNRTALAEKALRGACPRVRKSQPSQSRLDPNAYARGVYAGSNMQPKPLLGVG